MGRKLYICGMAQKVWYQCPGCGYKCEAYEGKGFFGQRISQVVCMDCRTVQNLTVGGVIADVVPSFQTEYGRLCPQCMSQDLRLWDGHTCPKCSGNMVKNDDYHEFWT